MRFPAPTDTKAPKPEEEGRRRGRSRWEEDEVEEVPRGKALDKGRRRQRFDAEEEDEGDWDNAKQRRKREMAEKKRREQEAAQPQVPSINLPEYISVSNLATALGVRLEPFVRKMEELGFTEIAYDHVIDAENAGLIAVEFGFEPVVDTSASHDLVAAPLPEDPAELLPRPPIVTIMGHVDHGKTTILDYMRKSSVAATEHGGITQHIGAFSVLLSPGRTITFLDTPGHAAFLAMRQRGATVTDIVILVVAADDSVMPQTIEAIKHAKAANVPLIVALNKIDKEEANPARVKRDLSRYGVETEDIGGDTQVVEVSGKTGQGMRELEDAVVALGEVLDMRAPPTGPVEGWILEAATRRNGKVATILVRRGTLRPGDIIVAGTAWAKVRTLHNEAGVTVDEAPPGTPIEVDGWRGAPAAGDEVLAAEGEHHAAAVTELRADAIERESLARDMNAINAGRRAEQERREREKQAAREAKALETEADGAVVRPRETKEEEQEGVKYATFIIKADVAGSVEAVAEVLSGLGNHEVRARVLRSGVGPVTRFDVEHAAAAGGGVIAFNVGIEEGRVRQIAEDKGVRLLEQSIIYRIAEDVTASLNELLPPKVVQRVVGEAEVLQVFHVTFKRNSVTTAGCRVRNGVMKRGSKVRVVRGGETVYDGLLASLRSGKKDTQEMNKDTECGMTFAAWDGFRVGDHVQCYEEAFEKRYL
ncbi:initiation factor 2 [Trichodelitschia bisporula]|uniref:Translation initiation factor IF-2, mitochondrial n=1 Tax=Trichodelitschia bisporula TaxID=703511 RepID=A0A6G1HV71_9PEZI|nr:initiation factor 2 [Trichodelitschia bisporula]